MGNFPDQVEEITHKGGLCPTCGEVRAIHDYRTRFLDTLFGRIQVKGAGHDRVFVAPTLIPCKPEGRIKSDRRNAINLSVLQRAGALTAVYQTVMQLFSGAASSRPATNGASRI